MPRIRHKDPVNREVHNRKWTSYVNDRIDRGKAEGYLITPTAGVPYEVNERAYGPYGG